MSVGAVDEAPFPNWSKDEKSGGKKDNDKKI